MMCESRASRGAGPERPAVSRPHPMFHRLDGQRACVCEKVGRKQPVCYGVGLLEVNPDPLFLSPETR